MNASSTHVTAMLAQVLDGALRVYADWVREGEPSAVFGDLMRDVMLEAGQRPRLVMGPQHFDQYNNFGLRQAATKQMWEVRKGTPPEMGRAVIRDMIRKELRQMPALLVDQSSRWTANGFAGGYCRALLKGGMLGEYAEEGPYRVMMESLESFAGLMKMGMAEEDDAGQEVRYDYSNTGRRFITARR
jgi:hypothetical protein